MQERMSGAMMCTILQAISQLQHTAAFQEHASVKNTSSLPWCSSVGLQAGMTCGHPRHSAAQVFYLGQQAML